MVFPLKPTSSQSAGQLRSNASSCTRIRHSQTSLSPFTCREFGTDGKRVSTSMTKRSRGWSRRTDETQGRTHSRAADANRRASRCSDKGRDQERTLQDLSNALEADAK